MDLFKRMREGGPLSTTDFDARRREMVQSQLKGRGIKSERVLEAMGAVPRHCFVPSAVASRAYEDRPLPIGQKQTISQPFMVAVMTEMLDVLPGDRVLEIGTGSGYQAAVLSLLAKEVISIERNEALADEARARLADSGYLNVRVLHGDGSLGCPESRPYNAILVAAAAPRIARCLKDQLCVGGALVCPVGSREVQRLMKVVRTEDGNMESEGTACMFVPLLGEKGW